MPFVRLEALEGDEHRGVVKVKVKAGLGTAKPKGAAAFLRLPRRSA